MHSVEIMYVLLEHHGRESWDPSGGCWPRFLGIRKVKRGNESNIFSDPSFQFTPFDTSKLHLDTLLKISELQPKWHIQMGINMIKSVLSHANVQGDLDLFSPGSSLHVPWLTMALHTWDPWDLLFPVLQNHLWMPRKNMAEEHWKSHGLTKVRNANYRNMQRQGLPAKRKCILEYHRLSTHPLAIKRGNGKSLLNRGFTGKIIEQNDVFSIDFHCYVWLLESNPPLF